MRPTTGLLRGLRASCLAVVGFNLALIAHVSAGGAAPAAAVLLLLAGLVCLAAVLVTRTRLNLVRIGISLSALQLVLHEALMRLGSPAVCPVTEVSTTSSMHMGHGGQPMASCAAGLAHAGLGQGSILATTTMVGAHLAATAVMAGLLAYGEKALWFLAGYVRPARWLRVSLPEPKTPARIVTSGGPPTLCRQFTSGGVGRRGPPMRGLLTAV
jgi:hypothetical protein